MQTEKQLLKKLEDQIAKIERFILDLQQDHKWQKIFFRNKLYKNLNGIFKKNYSEYSKYLEEIIKDYTIIVKSNNDEMKKFYIAQLESKIFSLFKLLRSLKKYSGRSNNQLDQQISYRQQQNAKLEHTKLNLENMLLHIDKQSELMRKQLMHGTSKPEANKALQERLLKLLAKKGELERELFSVKERLELNTY